MSAGDTIVALSSGGLPSGIAILRISGARTPAVLDALAGGTPEPRVATLRPIGPAGAPIDTGLVLWFPGPASFTGEDSAELQIHGSRAVVRSLLRELASLTDVRLAEAGEFTRRAFLNGKLDLTQVEGLGDLIAAETETQRRQAADRLGGELSHQILAWRERLIALRAEIEAHLDFSDEGDVGTELPLHLEVDILALADELDTAAARQAGGRIVREGFRVVLAGSPNAGKSSLLNALARSDIAIVTSEAGTTRDLKEVPVEIGGQLCILVDTAGLRETGSLAEAEGVQRALKAAETADMVIWLQAPDTEPRPGRLLGSRTMLLHTKGDLPGAEPDAISVRTGRGLDMLLEKIGLAAQEAVGPGSILVSHERDRTALERAAASLAEAARGLGSLELAAEALRNGTHVLEALIGRVDSEAILDRLFAGFCIGK